MWSSRLRSPRPMLGGAVAPMSFRSGVVPPPATVSAASRRVPPVHVQRRGLRLSARLRPRHGIGAKFAAKLRAYRSCRANGQAT